MPTRRISDFGAPPAPTVAILMDGDLKPGDTFEWEWDGRRCRYHFRIEDTFNAKALVLHWATYPDVVSSSESPSYLTFVRLVD